jgi:hypothetical protein
MLPVKNYTLTETEQTIDFLGEGDYYHVKNNGDSRAHLAYLPSDVSHEITAGADGVVALDAGQVFHYAVIPTWELVAVGNGLLTVMTTAENTNPFDSAASASANSADGGDWDITKTYKKSAPHLWDTDTEIDWGDGSFSVHLYSDSQSVGNGTGAIWWDDTSYAHAPEVDKIIRAEGYVTRTDDSTGVKTGKNIAGDFKYGTTGSIMVRPTAYAVGVEMYYGKKSIVMSYYSGGAYTGQTYDTDLYLTYTKVSAD